MQPGTRLGPYEIVAPIGAGGMGEVYRARDTRLGRDVAIKVLPGEFAADPERLRRFEREAKATAALSHPNILEVHDVGTHGGVPYLVEEWLEGESLGERIKRGALTAPEALSIARQIAAGLAAAHEKGIVHRDLKPANVFLTVDRRVKVLDFGLAKLVGTIPTGEAETLTHAPTGATESGRVLGTVAYMSPEQARGQPVDLRTDVFSSGVVLYEMLSGERPFRGATGTDVVAAILKEAPAPLPQSVPVRLAEVVSKCLAKEPEGRYQGGSDLLAALQQVEGEAAPLWPSLKRSVRRHPLLTAANAVAAVVVLGVALNVGGLRQQLLGGSSARVIRMAVLPFANLSGDPEQEYLSDGLTQEMIAQLGGLHPQSLSVIARTSVMRYKKGDTPIDRIGRELGVAYVLEGSARREGGRIRVTAELIKASDQTQLWTETYEREMSGILSLQSEVARKVAGALALRLLPSEEARLASARTVNPEAYEAYLKGSHQRDSLTQAGLDAAQRYFELALEKDPNFAPAVAGIANVWACRQQVGFAPTREAGPKARAFALRALEMDDSNGAVHAALGGILAWTDFDWAGAERELKRAIEIGPDTMGARYMYSHVLMIQRRPAEAMPQIERAVELDPFNIMTLTFYAVDLISVRRYDEAIAKAREALRLQPGAPVALAAVIPALHEKRRFDEVITTAARYYDEWGYPDVKDALERGFAESGYAGAWQRALDLEASRHGGEPGIAWDAANNYAMVGDRERALDWLERAMNDRDPNVPYINCSPWWDPWRSEPRFKDVLRRLNLPPD